MVWYGMTSLILDIAIINTDVHIACYRAMYLVCCTPSRVPVLQICAVG